LETIKANLSTYDYFDMRLANLICIGLVISVLLVSAYNIHLYFRFQKEIHDYEEKNVLMEQRFQKIKHMQGESSKKIDENDINSIKAKADFVNRLIAIDIFPWQKILDELELIMPGDMILQDFTTSDDFSTIILKGDAGSTQSISLFLNRLNAVKLFQNNLLLGFNVKSGTLAGETKGETLVLRFKIESQLRIDLLFSECGYEDLGKILVNNHP